MHDLNGHLFERRFHAELVEGNGHLLEVVRYIVLNPVRAGLCRRATEWRWSSYLATVGRQRLPKLLTIGWLLSLFSANASRAKERYAAFVEVRRRARHDGFGRVPVPGTGTRLD